MDAATHLEHARTAGERITEVAAGADLQARVPTCPDHDLGSLLVHTGGFCRFARGCVEQGRFPDLDFSDVGDDPRAWHVREHARLVETLEASDPEEVRWSWGADQRLAFWFRRAAQELAVHCHDVERGAGVEPRAIDPALAVDGIDELLVEFGTTSEAMQRDGLAAKLGTPGATLHLHATDHQGEWMVTVGERAFDVRREHGKGDVAARGPAADLYLFLWGRVPLDRLEVHGDRALLERWSERATI